MIVVKFIEDAYYEWYLSGYLDEGLLDDYNIEIKTAYTLGYSDMQCQKPVRSMNAVLVKLNKCIALEEKYLEELNKCIASEEKYIESGN